MGLAATEDRDPEAQELLPVYSENDPSTSVGAGALEPPSTNATPAEIQTYILSILERRGVEAEYARTISARWLLGTGAELREYTRDMFVGIFGAEEGWVIHNDVRASLAPEVARIAAEEAERKRVERRAHTYAARWKYVTCLVAGLIMLCMAIAMCQPDILWLNVVGFMIGFVAVFTTFFSAMLLVFLALNHWGNFSF